MAPCLHARAPGSSTSFPSGHTVGAFALAGVLIFGSRSTPVGKLVRTDGRETSADQGVGEAGPDFLAVLPDDGQVLDAASAMMRDDQLEVHVTGYSSPSVWPTAEGELRAEPGVALRVLRVRVTRHGEVDSAFGQTPWRGWLPQPPEWAKLARDALKLVWDLASVDKVDSERQLLQYRELAGQLWSAEDRRRPRPLFSDLLTGMRAVQLICAALVNQAKTGEGCRIDVPMIGTCALFILFSNVLGLVPGMAPPTDNLNTNAAAAFVVFIWFNFHGLRDQGFHHITHILNPVGEWWGWFLAPLLGILFVLTCAFLALGAALS